MKAKLLLIITTVIATCALITAQFAPPTYAEETEDICTSSAADSVKAAAGCNGNNDTLPSVIVNIIYGVIAVSGLVAVIYILIGGYGYMSSNGDAGKLEKAKKTILYACIGLAVCALSFAIVNFTYNKIINYQPSSEEESGEGSKSTPSKSGSGSKSSPTKNN
ncbi:hypothetical protein IKG60_01660 [Candidatus Saccharibacteria bacterium]|nr:hypothetical protein [Candidatus Saccharibacteria bacterium]